uniref:hypothetical protein n=1 Tax=Pannonibacter phragmitetus TaxID=121719 RepID=UPI000B96D753|nr:hypothetical protein [Pannonibacter phragmitetus]
MEFLLITSCGRDLPRFPGEGNGLARPLGTMMAAPASGMNGRSAAISWTIWPEGASRLLLALEFAAAFR